MGNGERLNPYRSEQNSLAEPQADTAGASMETVCVRMINHRVSCAW